MKKILSLMLVLVMVFSMLAMTACDKDEPKNDDTTTNTDEAFNYAKLDIKKYISLDRSLYAGATVEVDVEPEIDDSSVEAFIEYLLEQNADSETKTDIAIENGDTVKVYFRGSYEGVDFEGGSNMTDSTPSAITIGSGTFIDGFEEGLVGVVPNTTSFTKITSGTVSADNVVYVSYTYAYGDKEGTVSSERIDLASTAKYDEAFVASIVGKTIGTAFTFTSDVDMDGDGVKESVTYDMKVTFASLENAVVVNATFPDPYPNNEELSGKTVQFHVIVTELARPIIPELSEELVKKSMGFESETGATGDAYLAEFREYVFESLKEERAYNVKNAGLNKLLLTLIEKAEIKEYPQAALEESMSYYNEELKYYFDAYSQQYADFPYETAEEFAPDFFGLAEGTDYNEWLEGYAKEEVCYNLVIYYIIDEEKIALTKDEKAEQVQALAEYYATYYSNYYGYTYTADDMLEMIGEENLAREILFSKVSEFLVENITIVENIVEAEQ